MIRMDKVISRKFLAAEVDQDVRVLASWDSERLNPTKSNRQPDHCSGYPVVQD
jgi:ribosome-binding protein aMBF1 (putative translation factor)